MPHITRDLLRKRAEHNEGLISTLEEVSLHQEELEDINEVLGSTCRKLKILYLQNNIISKMENLSHLRELEYLNLALNNITKIEGLQNCEFLKKLDLTVNFIDFDTLRESIEHLSSLDRLEDLYLMGNPSQSNWDNFDSYIIGKLPQIRSLDGKEITKSMKIAANQKLASLERTLEQLAKVKREEKEDLARKKLSEPSPAAQVVVSDEEDANKLTEHCPETRNEIYMELAQQKKEKEDRERANMPKERDYVKEHLESVSNARGKEQDTDEKEIKQKNEGGWEFSWDDDNKKNDLILEVKLSKFLDSSLIDVDVHPTYVSMVIKNKLLRLRLPTEVKAGESRCQRSKISGSLSVIMPKVNPKEIHLVRKEDVIKPRSGYHQSKTNNGVDSSLTTKDTNSSRSRKVGEKKLSMQELMLQEALNAQKSSPVSSLVQSTQQLSLGSEVNYRSIVPQPKSDDTGVFTGVEKWIPSESDLKPGNSLITELD